MRRQTLNQEQKCPKCGAVGNQMKKGFNRSGTQRCMCKECGATYTINPKRREYPEEIQEAAIKSYYSGASGREVGRLFGMNKSNVYNWLKKNSNDCG